MESGMITYTVTRSDGTTSSRTCKPPRVTVGTALEVARFAETIAVQDGIRSVTADIGADDMTLRYSSMSHEWARVRK